MNGQVPRRMPDNRASRLLTILIHFFPGTADTRCALTPRLYGAGAN